MRINLNCPFAEKEDAKLLGARWDVARKVWYIVDVEDLTPYMRWIRPERETSVGEVTLTDFLVRAYGGRKALGVKAARAFGVPYPLRPGWADRHGSSTVSREQAIKLIEKIQGKTAKPPKRQTPVLHLVRTPAPASASSCGCQALPWEDCEHTSEARGAGPAPLTDLAHELDHQAREHMRSMSLS